MKDVKKAIRNGEVLIGTGQEFPYPAITEMLGYLGWDFVVINFAEMAAAPYGMEIENLIRAAYASDIIPVAKLAKIDDEAIAKAINCGAKAITLTINNREELIAAMRAAKFPPEGYHRVAPFRATKYGVTSGFETAARANEEVQIWPIIETKEAAENMEEIISVEGLEVITIGPFDLRLSLGNPESQETLDAVKKYWRKLVDLSKKKGVSVEFFGIDVDSVREGIAMGCSVLLVSNDLRMMSGTSQRLIGDVREAAKKPH